MVERGRGARFVFQPLAQVFIRAHRGRQHLQRDGPLQLRVVREINLTHPARPDERTDLVATEPRTGLKHRRRFYLPSSRRYDARVARPLFVLSGIGGDERLFDAQRAVRDIRPIARIEPEDAREPLSHYAARLARTLPIDEPFDLGGASFGGMIALELARHLSPERVFLFGSCRSLDGVAPLLRAAHSLATIAPDRLLHPPRMLQTLLARFFGATTPTHVELFAQMLAATPPSFLRWAVRAVFTWSGVADLPIPIHHVHGARDRVIPVHRVKPDCVIAGAGHLLNVTHADAVNGWLALASRRAADA